MKQFFLRLITVLTVILPMKMLAQQPYAVLSGKTVTFYYDNKRGTRNGTMAINNSVLFSISPYGTATTAIFDASFSNYRPTDTSWWFMYCPSLTTITGMENLNTQDVTDMTGMFYNCSGLTSLDLSGFNTQNVKTMWMMFNGCSSLTSLDLSNFNTQNVTNMEYMFYDCSSLTSLNISSFNTQNVVAMGGMFYHCSSLTSLDIRHFDTSNVKSMSRSPWPEQEYRGMFEKCSGLTSIDLSNFNTQNVTHMRGLFLGCSGLTSLDVSGFNTQNVTDMDYMFSGCSGLTSLDVSGFNTQNVTDMGFMFRYCSGLTSLDVSAFNTQNVTDMRYMFYNCSGLTSLDVSGFNTQNVTEMGGMFSGCSGLEKICVGSIWSTDNVSSGSSMFDDCTKLVGGMGTAYDEQHTDYTYARIDGGEAAPGYFTEKTVPTETVTALSSPSFTVTLDPNGGTAQYFSNYYRLGKGGSLTLHGKSNVDKIVSVKMNLQDPARCGNNVTVSAGTLVGDSVINVNDTTLTITAQGSWPQLWLSSLDVTYEGTAPHGTYAILLPQHLAHGTVTSNYDWANEGDVVTLTATPDDDCHLKLLYANQGAVTLTPSATSIYRYTFTMPAEDVAIGAVFAEGDITTDLQLNVPEDAEADATPIYNLQGQRLTRLQRGVNIVGGRKQVLR